MIKTPTLVVNFKTYAKATGEKAVELAIICDQIAQETGKNIVIAVQEADMFRVAEKVSIPVFSQDIEPIEPGAHTGHTLPEAVKESGAVGTLLNHSEYKFPIDVIASSIKRAKEIGLATIVCAPTPEEASEIAKLEPDMIAIEPPELIGGDVSVSTAQPEIISGTIEKVHAIREVPVLCGAGIKNKNDVEIAIKLGSVGILVASGVVKAEDPAEVLRDLAEGM